MSETRRIGQQVGEFMRGLLEVTEPPVVALPSNKYLLCDAAIVQGPAVSLDMEVNENRLSPPFAQDVVFNGIVQFPFGRNSLIQQIIARDYANALSLVRDSTDPNKYRIFAGEVAQPSDQPQPHEITLFERAVKGTSVQRATGQVWDPKSGARISFTVTHDPIEIGVGIVALTAALICGGIVIVQEILDHCTQHAQAMCGTRGVRKIVIQRKYGFSWKGGPEIGCGEDCQIECNP